ncbi:MAG: hypothetical protein FJW30_27400 [Acidobacteria bacterium]|nr:hypothetical protein [Acidobacteriota bacterium]
MRKLYALTLMIQALPAQTPAWIGTLTGCTEQSAAEVSTFHCSSPQDPGATAAVIEKAWSELGMTGTRSSDGIGPVLKMRHDGLDALVKIREADAGSSVSVQLTQASDAIAITSASSPARRWAGRSTSSRTESSRSPSPPVGWPSWFRQDPSLGKLPAPVTDESREKCLMIKFPRSISFVEEVRELSDYYVRLFANNGLRPNARMEKNSSILGSLHYYHASVTGTDGMREAAVFFSRLNTRHSFDVKFRMCPVY